MASQVSSAVGTAKQFTAQPDQVYAKRLNGIPLNWNVDTQRNFSYENISKGLMALGVSINDHALKHEENLYRVAQYARDQVMTNTSSEDRQRLSAIKLLDKSGKFNLQDNPYIVAEVERTRGSEVMRRIKDEWDIYRSTQKLSGSTEEELKNFETFAQEHLGLLEENEVIDNRYAFNMGASEEHEKNLIRVSSQYSHDKQEKLKLDRREGILNNATEVLNHVNIVDDPEAFRALVYPIFNSIALTETPDTEEEYRLMHAVLDKVANRGIGAIDAIQDIEINGKKIKDTYDLEGHREIAGAYDDRRYTEAMEKHYTALSKVMTAKGAREYIDKIENPIERREIEKKAHGIVEANIQRKRMEDKERAKALKTKTFTEVARRLGKDLVRALADGSTKLNNGDSLPMTREEVTRMGYDPDAMAMGAMEAVREKLRNGDKVGLHKVFRHKLTGNFVKEFLRVSLSEDLTRMTGETVKEYKDIPESVDMALTLSSLVPSLAGELLGDDVGRIYALKSLLSTHPNMQEAVDLYHKSNALMSTAEGRSAVKDAYEKIPRSNTYYFGNNYGLTSSGTGAIVDEMHNANILRQERYVAYSLISAGIPAEDAVEQARQQVSGQYFNYDGVLIPKEVTGKISSDEGVALHYFSKAIQKNEQEHAKGYATTVFYDADSNEIVIESAIEKKVLKRIHVDAIASQGYFYAEEDMRKHVLERTDTTAVAGEANKSFMKFLAGKGR